MSLRFSTLRLANLERLPQFRDRRGNLCHSEPDGSDWSPADWMVAVVGEVGELASNLKQVRRGDVSLEEMRPKIAKEMADIVIYLDIMAKQYNIYLGAEIIAKFNEVSERVGARVFIHSSGDFVTRSPESEPK